MKRISIKNLLPDTEYYMTYDGSTTMPACHETVTWVILNKPIYITKQQVSLHHFIYGLGVCMPLNYRMNRDLGPLFSKLGFSRISLFRDICDNPSAPAPVAE